MFELNSTQKHPETVSSSEISSTICFPSSGCLDMGLETVGSTATFPVPFYPPAGMPYIPSLPVQLHKTRIGLQETGSPQSSEGISPQYPGFPARYGPVPFASSPWDGRTESQSSEGNAPHTWRDVSKMQFPGSAKAANSSDTRKLPGKNVRQKVNNFYRNLIKGGLGMPSTSGGGLDVTRDKIHENIDGNPLVTTACNRPDTIDKPFIISAEFKQSLHSSIFSPNFGNGPFAVQDNRPASESWDRHNNRKNQDERVGANGNYLSDNSQASHFPSFGPWHDGRPSTSNALGPLQLNEASHLAPRGYPNIMPPKGVSSPTGKGGKRFPHRNQDTLGSRDQVRSQNCHRGPSAADLSRMSPGGVLREFPPNQWTNSFSGMPKHTSPAFGGLSSGAFQPRIVCNLCLATFQTLDERFFHYRLIHRLPLSDRETCVPLINLRNPADISRVQELGATVCIPLNNGLMRDLAIPNISVDNEGHYPNSLAPWNAVSALDFGTVKCRAFE